MPGGTLVVYDTTSAYGWLGELYATGADNLAGHFGAVTAEPIVNYTAGQLNSYNAVVYIGSTYDEPIPTAFLDGPGHILMMFDSGIHPRNALALSLGDDMYVVRGEGQIRT